MQANRSKVLSGSTDGNCESNGFSVTLRFNGKVLLLGVLLLPLLLRLGFWQLERADEKRNLQSYIAQQQSLPLVPSPDLQSLDNSWRYRQVSLTGHLDRQRYWFIDNKIHQAQVGYEVVVPLLTEQGITVLVNLGWVKAPPRREQLPVIDLPENQISLRGRFYQPQPNRLVRNLESQQQVDGSWPRRVQQLQHQQAEAELGMALFAEQLQLSPEDPAAFVVQWRDINVSPAKHMGYAVQWFAMALVLVIALLVVNTNLWQWLWKR